MPKMHFVPHEAHRQRKASLSSRHRLQKRLQCNIAGSSLARDGHVSCTRRLKTLDINDACLYLGYWGTGNGDMSASREVVREKARVARDLIKNHLLTQELFAELFAHCKESAPSGSRQPSSDDRRVSWRVCKKSRYKRIKMLCTYHGQPQTLYTPSQLQRVAMIAHCRQEYPRRPCCKTLINACGMKMS